MAEVEAVKTESQREQIEIRLADHGQVYFDIWKVGVNVALRIGDLLDITMDTVRSLDPDDPALRLIERKTGKARKIVVNKPALDIMQRRLADFPDHVYLFQSGAINIRRDGSGKRPVKALNQRSVLRVLDSVGQQITPRVRLGTHSMRKTRGYALHKAGMSIERISKVLNHSSPSVTMAYIGLVQQDIDDSFTELEL